MFLLIAIYGYVYYVIYTVYILYVYIYIHIYIYIHTQYLHMYIYIYISIYLDIDEHLNRHTSCFSPSIFGACQPQRSTQPGGYIAARTEERARRCYAKAGFKFESSRTASWGKKEHSGSEWQRWKKVPTWSIWVSKRQVTMSDQRWK